MCCCLEPYGRTDGNLTQLNTEISKFIERLDVQVEDASQPVKDDTSYLGTWVMSPTVSRPTSLKYQGPVPCDNHESGGGHVSLAPPRKSSDPPLPLESLCLVPVDLDYTNLFLLFLFLCYTIRF